MLNRLLVYPNLFLTFAKNSLIRDLMFPANFIIESFSSVGWMVMNLGFYVLLFQYTNQIGVGDAAWSKYQFFVFIATTMIINSIIQAFFMPNAQEFSELVRTGGLDYALLKPVDTQFLVSLRRVNWASLSNVITGAMLLVYAVSHIKDYEFRWLSLGLYLIFIFSGVLILYSIMLLLASLSVWLGRNQSLYNFWFYITNFSRYPMEIYAGPFGTPLRNFFTFIIPVLVVINVPARMMAKPFNPEYTQLAMFAMLATFLSLVGSRWFFHKALRSYKSASS